MFNTCFYIVLLTFFTLFYLLYSQCMVFVHSLCQVFHVILSELALNIVSANVQ